MELSVKIAKIKEKIGQLAVIIEQVRSENRLLITENKELKIKLQHNAEEIDFLMHQLAALKEQKDTQSFDKMIEKEEQEI